MEKLELQKDRKDLYNPSTKEPSLVEVPEMQFLLITGKGNPNTSQTYKDAVAALFSVAYTLKFMVKKGSLAIDYKVMPLEGQWWSEDMADFTSGNKEGWLWNMMIRQPEFITETMFQEALGKARLKAEKAGETGVVAQLALMHLEKETDGKCGTIMHIGPFTAEGPTIAKLHDFIKTSGFKITGKHREIYLTDIRKADPAKWKTVIRQPINK